ncbi:hypothetical protein JHK82_012377 [Glycine max]|nr:hypothetical protein JHK82_012377 [Glycine max]
MGNCGLVLDRKYGSLALASVPRVTGQPSCITDYDQEKFHYLSLTRKLFPQFRSHTSQLSMFYHIRVVHFSKALCFSSMRKHSPSQGPQVNLLMKHVEEGTHAVFQTILFCERTHQNKPEEHVSSSLVHGSQMDSNMIKFYDKNPRAQHESYVSALWKLRDQKLEARPHSGSRSHSHSLPPMKKTARWQEKNPCSCRPRSHLVVHFLVQFLELHNTAMDMDMDMELRGRHYLRGL